MGSARPRLAIVGGGGAMGRTFARHLAPEARELYLLDYFGVGDRPANLAKTLDELTLASARRLDAVALVEDASGWRWAGPVEARSVTAVGWLGARSDVSSERQDTTPPGNAEASDRDAATIVDALPGGAIEQDRRAAAILDTLSAEAPAATILFAAQPEHARELLPRADVVVFALGFESREAYARIVRDYAPYVRPGALVVDLGSTKTGPMEVLEREIPPDVDVLGAHPLFGPTVTDLTGLIVATVSAAGARARSPWRGWFLDQLARLRMIVTPTSAAEHDDAMAFVQALTHFVLLSFAYTFVRLDRDPVDLLAFRTPVFEPLLYLAARVAYLARTNPETYKSIQTFSTRPDARAAFLESARDLLAAIDAADDEEGGERLAELFRHFGTPWSPDTPDRRERERREHFLEMGARLVDNLNHLRQEIVGAVGQVRAVEEQRAGQPPRVVVGLVDLDLLAPGKQDVAARVRLRRLNLARGSVLGEGHADEGGRDHLIPLARARVLNDDELRSWLLSTNQLVDRRAITLRVPSWFDRDVLIRLLKGQTFRGGGRAQIEDVNLDVDDEIGDDGLTEGLESGSHAGAPERSELWTNEGSAGAVTEGVVPDKAVRWRAARVHLAIVLHPADLIEARRRARAESEPLDREIAALDTALDRTYAALEHESGDHAALAADKDRLKRARKALLDRRSADVDRAVRHAARQQVNALTHGATKWLLAHGCASDAGLSAPGKILPV